MANQDRQPQPKLTKKQRRQEQLEANRASTLADQEAKAKQATFDRNKRKLLIVAGRVAAIGTVAVGLGATGSLVLRQSAPAQPKSENETAARLKDLDLKISRNANILTDTASEIAEMAAEKFHQETGRERVNTKKVVEIYTNGNDYATRANSFKKDCHNTPDTNPKGIASTNKDLGAIIMNLRGLTDLAKEESANSRLATLTYAVLQHELGHLTVKAKPLRPEFQTYFTLDFSLNGYYAHGLAVRKQDANGCLFRMEQMQIFEECVVEDQAQRGVKGLFEDQYFRPFGYKSLMLDFGSMIRDPYFKKDPHKLFEIQGESDPAAFLEEIGKRGRDKFPQQVNDGNIGASIAAPMIRKHLG